MDTPGVESVGPVQPGGRIITLDIMRGFAIFGILLVNMEFFNHSVFTYVLGLNEPVHLIDRIARTLIAFFGEGKFYSVFSFLFGLGMALQMQRAADKRVRFVPFFLRRLCVLLLIGLVHAYLFWAGDILILYSILGAVTLLLFRNCSPRTLIIWAIACLMIPILINGALTGFVELFRLFSDGEEVVTAIFEEQQRILTDSAMTADRSYSSGTFAEVTRQRVRDMNFMYSIWPYMAFNILAMFLMGLAVGKKRIIENVDTHLLLIRKVLIAGFVAGISGNAIYVLAGESTHRYIPSVRLLLSIAGQTFGAPALALFYMAALVLLARKQLPGKLLKPLASVGRMAITNYLSHSLICTLIFFGYGLGFYGRIGTAAGVLLTVLIYLVQIPFSVFWLKHFRFGPMEWLWRTLTYGKIR